VRGDCSNEKFARDRLPAQISPWSEALIEQQRKERSQLWAVTSHCNICRVPDISGRRLRCEHDQDEPTSFPASDPPSNTQPAKSVDDAE
jgi:hypothetical protein